jgi:sugar phosphate permease
MFVHAFYPLLIGLVPALTPILIIIFLDNVIAPSVSLTHYNTLLHILPKERAQDASGLWSTIMNAVAFVCPLLGVALADWVGVQPVLIGCGILTIVGSLSFWKWQTPAQPLD